MKTRYKYLIVLSLCLASLFSGIFIMANDAARRDALIQGLETQLKDKGYDIVKAKFNSPEVIIQTSTPQEFIDKADMIHASTIFLTSEEGYVAVDSDFRYAYAFSGYNELIFSMVGFLLVLIGALFLFLSFFTWIMGLS